MKLFLIPYAGGSEYIYNDFHKYLDNDIEVIPVKLKGRGSRIMESCYKSVEEAVDDIFIQIYPEILNDDYSIFGHSMGSLLAYELYYKIRSEGCRMPSHMFFSGLGSPKKILYAPKYAGLSDREFEHKIMEMGGTPQEVLECEEFMDFFRPILRGDFSMIEKYVFKPQKLGIKCNTAVLVGKEDVKYCDCKCQYSYLRQGKCQQ